MENELRMLRSLNASRGKRRRKDVDDTMHNIGINDINSVEMWESGVIVVYCFYDNYKIIRPKRLSSNDLDKIIKFVEISLRESCDKNN